MLSKARFQDLLQLTRKKQRAAAGAFFVEGWRWLEEALALPQPPECVLVARGAARSAHEETLLARARDEAREFHEIEAAQLARLTDNVTAPGVAALVRWMPAPLDEMLRALPSTGPALVVALDALGDPGNAGTIVRSADWFGAAGVVFGAGSVEPANAKCVRATMGSLFHLPVVADAALMVALARFRENGFVAVGAALDGEALPEFSWPARTVLVIGNEAGGVQRELLASLDRRVRIPAYGRAESLNAAIASAVLMSDWRRVQSSAVAAPARKTTAGSRGGGSGG
jgi:TrmH family RNA methyltransferase